ncbi:MATE family efflux transporter [Candidatus Woesearchaeota archaeon]|nr:MATE family efflux transporter [Candidatus Woesearchaeota archaeon]
MSNNRNAKLVSGDVKSILVKLTTPMIFGMVGMVAFNLIDTFFVGRLGTLELAALTFTFPVIMVITSLALGIGIGTSAVVSQAIGRGDEKKIKRLTTDSLLLSLIIVLFFVIGGLLTIKPLFSLLGAPPPVIDLISDYMVYWYLGVIFVIVPMVGNFSIRATGDTKTPSMIMLVAVITNIILDPIFIFGFGPIPKMELKGAAIATIISRFLIFAVAFYVLYFREKMISFSRCKLKEIWSSWKQIMYIGVPVATTRMMLPVAIGVIVNMLSTYGPEAVAAFGIGTRIEWFALVVVFALSSVLGPFIGQNWAAKKYDRVKEGINLSMKFSMMWGAFLFVLLFFTGRFIGAIFNDNLLVVDITTWYMLIIPFSFGFQGIFYLVTTVLNVLQKPMQAAALIVFQLFGLYIPLSYLGSFLYGGIGIFAGMSIAMIISGIASRLALTKIIPKSQ